MKEKPDSIYHRWGRSGCIKCGLTKMGGNRGYTDTNGTWYKHVPACDGRLIKISEK